MAADPGALQADHLQIAVRRVGRSVRVLAASGALTFDTAPRLRSAYQELLQSERGAIGRLLLDLRQVSRFDATGTTTLLELSRDAERRGMALEVVDKGSRPQYVATGLASRIKFLSDKNLEALER